MLWYLVYLPLRCMFRIYDITWFRWWNRALKIGQEYIREIGCEPPWWWRLMIKSPYLITPRTILEIIYDFLTNQPCSLGFKCYVTLNYLNFMCVRLGMVLTMNYCFRNGNVYDIIRFWGPRQTALAQRWEFVGWIVYHFGVLCLCILDYNL